ncbi:AMP-binding protein [Frondihabitans australicus]|uniref:O-succinylbenzoic acid--CoA ligase n=1 Tax=Frondihabitans australicus TaxID=386892 RepID=A0A495IAL7_9MICO|nr:AMP-binding protein [Frondihabitans australicus]RKR73063.1 O-succinylbenzoic acid--CoA ligase [Frondihabitans australicus]
MKPLLALDARDPARIVEALRDALSGGPAINPRVDDSVPSDLPAEVETKIALVIETSGSTGTAKRVALSSGALLAGAAAADAALAGPGQWVLALPAHYVAGTNVIVRSIAAQTEPRILRPGHFDPADFVAAAEALYGPARRDAPARYASLVPAQLSTLLDAGAGEALRLFDAILVGGQATPAVLRRRALDEGVTVVRTYGSSETSGGCVYDGVPIGATRAAVVDGQLELSGPTLAEYYLGDPARTAATFVERDGVRWYRTGDAGSVAADGSVTVTGRLDDVIISGGEKVSLGTVERAVREVPGFEQAVVVRCASERWGEVPVVVVAGRRGQEQADLQILRPAVLQAAGRAARPDAVVSIDDLPLLASGKPDRVALTALVASSRAVRPS